MNILIPKEMTWKAINGELPFNELHDLVGKFPVPDDYYNYELIQKQINRFFEGEITPKYLAVWANVYSWAMTGSYRYNKVKTDKLFEIQDCLDGLSFIDSEENEKEIKTSARRFRRRFKELEEELSAYYQKEGYTTGQFLRKTGMKGKSAMSIRDFSKFDEIDYYYEENDDVIIFFTKYYKKNDFDLGEIRYKAVFNNTKLENGPYASDYEGRRYIIKKISFLEGILYFELISPVPDYQDEDVSFNIKVKDYQITKIN